MRLIRAEIPERYQGAISVEEYKSYLWKCYEALPNDRKRGFVFSTRGRDVYILAHEHPDFIDPRTVITSQDYLLEISDIEYTMSLQYAPITQRENSKKDMVLIFDQEHPELAHVPESSKYRAITRHWFMKKEDRFGFSIKNILAIQKSKSFVQTKQFAFSCLDIIARISVVDPEKALNSMRNGIGKHRAYGCGLALLHEQLNKEML